MILRTHFPGSVPVHIRKYQHKIQRNNVPFSTYPNNIFISFKNNIQWLLIRWLTLSWQLIIIPSTPSLCMLLKYSRIYLPVIHCIHIHPYVSLYRLYTHNVIMCCALHNAVWFWRVLFSKLLYGDWTFNIHNMYYGRMHVADGTHGANKE